MEAEVNISEYELERDKPMPGKKHAFVQMRLMHQFLFNYNEQFIVLPELSVLMKDRKSVPDLAIYENGTLSFEEDEIVVEKIPKGIIEILSPKQVLADLVIKSKTYLEAGVTSYWLVLPELTSIYVFHNEDDYRVFTRNDVLKDDALGVTVDLKELFR